MAKVCGDLLEQEIFMHFITTVIYSNKFDTLIAVQNKGELYAYSSLQRTTRINQISTANIEEIKANNETVIYSVSMQYINKLDILWSFFTSCFCRRNMGREHQKHCKNSSIFLRICAVSTAVKAMCCNMCRIHGCQSNVL